MSRGILFCVVAIALAGCSGNAPEILFVDRQVVVIADPASDVLGESLRVFVSIADEDGPDDLALITVVHDEAGLLWQLDDGGWHTEVYGGEQWYGHPRLELPRSSPLPRGRYQVLAEDRAGNRVDQTFFLSTGELPAGEEVPEIRRENDQLVVRSPGPVVIRAFTRSGELIVSQAVEPGPVPTELRERLATGGAERAYLYTQAETRDTPILVAGPFPIDPLSVE